MMLAVNVPAHETHRTDSTVSWGATLSGGGIQVVVWGSLDFDSYMELGFNMSAVDEDVQVSDVRLIMAAKKPQGIALR